MRVYRLILGEVETNSYLLENGDVSIVVDPAECVNEMVEFLNSAKKDKLILLTHAHFDHIKGAAELRRQTGAKIAVYELDAPATSDGNINLSSYFGIYSEPFVADVALSDGEILTFGETKIKVLHTPGHTVGSACFLIDDILISGDTLFRSSVGRTDFPGGSLETIKSSLKRLVLLDENIKVYSGHGEATTIGKEKETNPFLKGI